MITREDEKDTRGKRERGRKEKRDDNERMPAIRRKKREKGRKENIDDNKSIKKIKQGMRLSDRNTRKI